MNDQLINWNDNIYSQEFTEWEYVYASDHSIESALKFKDRRIYLTTVPWNCKSKYICVGDWNEEEYKNWEEFNICRWEYIVKVPKEELIEITTKDWQTISITKEKAIELWFNIKTTK